MIHEKHCCRDCSRKLIVPAGRNFEEELLCLDCHKEVNKYGGLTDCEFFVGV